MSRPRYETKENLAAEKALAIFIGKIWRLDTEKLPDHYYIDYAFLRRNDIIGWAELKRRYFIRTTFPTYMVGVNKIIHGITLSKRTGLPFAIVVEWDDVIGYLKGEELETYRKSYGGRSDRGDPQDREPMAHYEIERFHLIRKAS